MPLAGVVALVGRLTTAAAGADARAEAAKTIVANEDRDLDLLLRTLQIERRGLRAVRRPRALDGRARAPREETETETDTQTKDADHSRSKHQRELKRIGRGVDCWMLQVSIVSFRGTRKRSDLGARARRIFQCFRPGTGGMRPAPTRIVMTSWLWKLALAGSVATAAAIAGCATAPDETSTEPDETEDAVTTGTAGRSIVVDEDTSVLVEHPETLRALEKNGFDLGSRLAGTAWTDNAGFGASGEGQALIDAVAKDIETAKAADRGVGVGMAFGHRAFDARWMSSAEGHFDLVAVTNRMDRRHADPNACGELHLVYRLSYTNAKSSSRLPMTVMLVYPQAKQDGACTAVAGAWLSTKSATTIAAKVDALVKGPLASASATTAPKVEMNYQLVRWPSTTRTDMGGHAEYSLRVFKHEGASLAPVRLENTPRTDLDATEKGALAKWVSENIEGIDRGTAKLPDELLAETAISVSPKGLARAQNRPFAVLFGPDGASLGDVDLAGLTGLTMIKSKAALVRRLDTMSCNGCHQSQGIAGFHIVGHDRPEMADINALIQGVSAHAREQVAFRKKDVAAIAAGRAELAPIPFAERAAGSDAFEIDGGYGAACGLGDPGFAAWTCAKGMKCSDINGDQVGMCVTEEVRMPGEACEESDTSFTADPHKDKVTNMKVLACKGGARCVRSGGDPGGFPTGMCGGSCSKVGQVSSDGSICALAVPSGFNACIGACGEFAKCAAGGPKAVRKACSATKPCGQDYVCSAVPDAPPGVGACLPPYFIFQARVDGHIFGTCK